MADRDSPERERPPSFSARVISGVGAALKFPFKLTATLIARTAQVLLAIFILILHPQLKWLLKLVRWLLRLIARSPFVRHYITPVIQRISTALYDPYFAFLLTLPPFWATLSIALPLAILEPAKLYATILIAEHPKTGILFWLFMHGLSFVLIDTTWTAVRPQSRKIWLVSRLHAWGWLNFAYGKYWITQSRSYRTVRRWIEELRAAARALLAQLTTPRRRTRP